MPSFRAALLILAAVTATLIACSPDETAGGDTPSIPAELVGTWLFHSATLNGSPISMAELLQFAPGSDTADVAVYANGTYVYTERDTSNATTYTNAGSVTVSGSSITLTKMNENGVAQPPEVFLRGTYVLSGTQLTLTASISGNVIVAVLLKKE